jgi:hypothetical protein
VGAVTHLCDLATETGGFGIFDCLTAEAVMLDTDAACRRLAEERYPGCKFALTRTSAVHEANASLPAPHVDNIVVIAVCLPAAEGTVAIHAYIFGAVHGADCIPFTPAVWLDCYDLLTKGN